MAVQEIVTVQEKMAAGTRRRVFSGIQPSGTSHIGNYLGAIRNWVQQQEFYNNLFCIVNLHAITLPTTRDSLRANTLTMANTLIACGIDPKQSILFVQSDVPEHAELAWILSSVTQFGELRRMTQFKDKTKGQDEGVSAALFTYPILQAADILLYDTHLVPVGEDQQQHIELARDIAQRFNTRYGETFVVPQHDIKPEGARIMALDDPTKKMSKSSDSPGSYIALTDDPDTIRRKVRRAVTDSGSEVVGGPGKPALTNLISIYALFSGIAPAEVEARYVGKGYGAFKQDLAEIIVEAIEPIQRELVKLDQNPEIALSALQEGADRASEIARRKITEVRDRVGLSLSKETLTSI
jgi:tryptophanyl-tRNA synthetase